MDAAAVLKLPLENKTFFAKLSLRAKIAIGFLVTLVIIGVIVGSLVGAGVITSPKSEKSEESPAPPPLAVVKPAPAPAVVPGSMVVPVPAPAPTPAPAPAPAAPTGPAALSLSNDYIDRGYWGDGGYTNGNSEDWDISAYFNRAIANTYFVDLNTMPELISDNDKLMYAKSQAILGNFDTFAFQHGNELWLGNYNSTFQGIVYKYDKFGETHPENTYFSNHVYSKVAPYSFQTRAADFVDRGCWAEREGGRAISKTWINMNDTDIPSSEWFDYALEKATQGGYDTFGFQAGFALFLGNYNSTYKYDIQGPVPTNRECMEFGDGWINRVYSTVAPNTI